MNDQNGKFKPYIPADKVMPEFTPMSVILGVILAVVFGAANAYLGLRVGMTISASIPAAVISMGVVRVIMRKKSILENNMVQTIGSAGESLAAGAIFTLPVLFMWAAQGEGEAPSFFMITVIAICGGVLGVLFMIPLRTALIVEEHGVLPFPEGQACSEVLLAGEEGGDKSKIVFSGLGISAVYKFIADGLRLFPSEIDWSIKAYPGSGIGMDVLPSLVGVGYICGAKVSSYLLSGAVLGWFVIMPLLVLIGGDAVMYPATQAFNTLSTWDLWGNFIRYIGAGAVAAGGILSLIKSLPLITKAFSKAMKGFGHKGETAVRTERSISLPVSLIGAVIVTILLWLIPGVPIGLLAALIILVFGFFFATVSARMVGLVGSSNSPVSGMAIATLLVAAIILKATGNTGIAGMTTVICIGTVICIVAAMAGDTSQDLKTGYIVGATPIYQQYGELIGTVASGLAIAGVLALLNAAWSYGSQGLPAPQAMLMKMVVEGVMGGNLPWGLVFTGIFLAIAAEIVGVPVLPFALGLYLPIHLSLPIMAGGLIRLWVEKRKFPSETRRKEVIDNGVLYSSGMIAGEGIVGIILAVCTVFGVEMSLGGILGNWGGLAFFAGLIAAMLAFIFGGKKNKE